MANGPSPRRSPSGRQRRRRGAAGWAGLVAVALAAAGGGSTPTAQAAGAHREVTAGDKETARTLMDDGDKRFRAGDFRGALDAYQAADKIMAVPTTGIEVGRAQDKLGLLLEARDTWLRVARSPAAPDEPAPFTQARAETRRLAAAVGRRIPSLRVEVEGVPAGVEVAVRIDDVLLPPGTHRHPRKVNPGEKLIRASAAGYRTTAEHVVVAEGQELVVELALEPAPSQPPPGHGGGPGGAGGDGADDTGGVSPLVWIGFGIGGAGVAVGAVTGALSLSQTSDIEEQCEGTACAVAVEDDIAQAELLANVSNVGFAVGGLGVVLGIVGIVLSGDDEGTAPTDATTSRLQLTPLVGPGIAGLAGRF